MDMEMLLSKAIEGVSAIRLTKSDRGIAAK